MAEIIIRVPLPRLKVPSPFALWLAVETWMERRAQLRALASLNDTALKDLGLSRADVEYWAEPAARSADAWMR
jgi:uncharacterized protein YjiS (DUF1127 family)